MLDIPKTAKKKPSEAEPFYEVDMPLDILRERMLISLKKASEQIKRGECSTYTEEEFYQLLMDGYHKAKAKKQQRA